MQDRFPEQRLGENQFVIAKADPRPVDAAHHLEAELEDADQRIAEDESQQRHQRQHIEIGGQP